MNEKNQRGVTFEDIVRVSFGRKLVLALFILILTVLTSSYCMISNKNNKLYYASFQYSINNDNAGQYFGKLDIREILSIENLEKIKEANQEYSNIDLELILSDRNTAMKNLKQVVKNNDSKEDEINQMYVLTIPQKYFKNYSQAKKFMQEIIQIPLKLNFEILEKVDPYYNLEVFENANSYELQVDYLIKHYDFLIKSYDSLIQQFGFFVLENGYNLNDVKNNITLNFSGANDLNLLYQEIKLYGYVKNESLIDLLKTKKTILEKEKELNENKKNNLIKQRDDLIKNQNGLQNLDLSDYNKQIIELSNTIADIDFELKNLCEQIENPKDSKNFEDKLSNYKNKLNEYTEDLTYITKRVLEENSSVYYNDISKVTSKGGKNVIVFALIGAILGLVIGLCFNLIIDRKKLVLVPEKVDNDVVKKDTDEEDTKIE